MTTIKTSHQIAPPKAKRYYHSNIWELHPQLRAAKEDARALALAFGGGTEEDFERGRRIYVAVRNIWPRWQATHQEAMQLYEKLRGKPLTLQILQDRVHKMYYIYQPGKNVKGHGISSEHPNARA